MSITSPVIAALPNNLLNGTPNDASQVMADFNTIRNGVNNALASVTAQSGASYIGVTTDARWLGTSVQDALAQLISNTQINDTGTVNAIAFTTTPNITALTNNLFVWFKAGNTNTSSAVTIAAGTTAATGVVLNDGVTLPAIGSIISGQIYGAWYSTGLSKWVLINPGRATGSFTGTLSGMTATVTGTVNFEIEPTNKNFSAWVANAIIGTSNTNGMTMTNVPNSLITITAKAWACAVVDSAAGAQGFIETGTANTWSFYKGAALNGFTGSSTKGLGTNPHFSFSTPND